MQSKLSDNRNKEESICAYVTDVEGNLDYFKRYVDESWILGWKDPEEKTTLKFKREDKTDIFVYGGDSQDKGIGDIRFVKMLLEFKEEYKDRVVFIIGNRDINKLRLTSELKEDCINDTAVLTDRSFPYWDAAEKRVTPQMFLDKNPVDNGGRENTAANRLRYILKHTMGADGAFERRRHELSIILKCKKQAVSDEHVVQSYRDEVDPEKDPDNFMLRYLQQGKLAYVFREHLFVHGAVNNNNFGTVPGQQKRMQRVHDWVEALNAWCQQQVADFVSDPYSGKNGRDRKGSGLMDYGVPGGNADKTVVYQHNLENGNGVHFAKEVRAYMLTNRITSIVTGHQPHGDCPLVVRSGDDTGELTLITADTSYSQMKHQCEWGEDNRGEAVSEVLLFADGGSQVHGKRVELADAHNTTTNYINYELGGKNGDPYVGKQLLFPTFFRLWLSNTYTSVPALDENDIPKWWVKAKMADGKYLICWGNGFKIHNICVEGVNFFKDQEFTQPEKCPDELLIKNKIGVLHEDVQELLDEKRSREQKDPKELYKELIRQELIRQIGRNPLPRTHNKLVPLQQEHVQASRCSIYWP